MASPGQKNAVAAPDKAADCGTIHNQRSLVSPDEPVYSRMEEFFKEEFHEGNRHVMLPDQDTDQAAVVKKAKERMRKEIMEVAALFGALKETNTGETSGN
ncbi:hypothetical protein GGR54DRAFT_324726 [Hypoxylon sp. NC1633]|nr:hypothetical protein GGR54DRAFT_324726 [Hypoxylon sp. NC1633]